MMENQNTELQVEESANNEVVSAYTDLPIGLLICQPIMEVAKGQAALCNVYLDTLMRLAYTKDSKGDNKKTNVISFDYEKPVADKVTGTVSMKKYTINAPLLSLVPVPAFTMAEATVRFNLDVNVSATDTEHRESELTTEVNLNFWGQSAKINGKIGSTSDHTRSTDSHAKYEIYARATQQPPSEGMAKLTELLSSTIEPIEMTK